MTGTAKERKKVAMRGLGTSWDVALVLMTSLTLMLYGLLCLFGMFYYKFNSTASGWSITAYQGMMNRSAAPLTVLLILWLVLCIPKRLFSRKTLFKYCTLVLTASIAAYAVGGLIPGLALALVLSAALQALILLMVVTGARLRFSKRGMAMRFGSSLIHLGFVLLVLDIVLWQGAPWHLVVFWIATFFMTAGCLVTFYFPRFR